MHPSKEMSRTIGGKRYSVKTSTLIASDEYWDGHNFERGGRNTFLYKTRLGAFFQVNLSQWQGERDTIEPLTEAQAKELYDRLPEHSVEWDEAFGEEVQEAEPDRGRPPLYGETMRQTAVYLPENMIEWLQNQEGTASETMRKLIAAAMKE